MLEGQHTDRAVRSVFLHSYSAAPNAGAATLVQFPSSLSDSGDGVLERFSQSQRVTLSPYAYYENPAILLCIIGRLFVMQFQEFVEWTRAKTLFRPLHSPN